MVEYVKGVKLPLEKLKKYRYPALILALGLLLLLLPSGGSRGEKTQAMEPVQDTADFDLAAFTKEAEALLSGIQGAGKVKLLLTLETDGRREFQIDQNRSQSESGEQLQQQTVLVSGDGGQTPVAVTRSYPSFRGAVVLTQGATSQSLTLSIKEALSSLTGLGMDRITVLQSE